MPKLTIFHTNDFHNKLTDQKARRIRDMKSSSPDSILLDAGDAIWAANIFYRPGGEPILKLMSDAGYDAMAMGNREFHFLASGLKKKIGFAKFPILCANVRPTGESELPLKSHIIIERNGLAIVILGLTVPMITQRMLSRKVSSFVFDDPIETAARIVPELRKQADLIIALTHIGLEADRQLALAVPGIDLIVGGHTHTTLNQPEIIGRTAIVQAGWYARSVGKIEIEPGGAVRGEILQL
jgi:2',3'-cyclic-nucleotide 2'-phosphodiesterase (5'-nucleotidase family)